MKKIISLLLSIAMMLLLSISIFATPITGISVDFDPILGADIPDNLVPIEISVNSSNNTTSKLRFKLTGSDTIETFENTSFSSANEIMSFSLEQNVNHAIYRLQEYLFVFSCELPADTTINETTDITTTSGDVGTYILTDEENNAYFYIMFTPRSVNTQEFDAPASSQSIDVTATYDDSVTETPVYSVVITWGSMDFTYHPSSNGTWNPATHTYSGGTEESWTCEDNANAITVINHSNAEITASFSYQASNGYDAISGKFFLGDAEISSAQTLPSAVSTGYDKAPTLTAHLRLNGQLTNKEAIDAKCGTVTVSISQ